MQLYNCDPLYTTSCDILFYLITTDRSVVSYYYKLFDIPIACAISKIYIIFYKWNLTRFNIVLQVFRSRNTLDGGRQAIGRHSNWLIESPQNIIF